MFTRMWQRRIDSNSKNTRRSKQRAWSKPRSVQRSSPRLYIERLEDRMLMSVDPKIEKALQEVQPRDFTQGIDSLLGGISTALHATVGKVSNIPLIGDKL